VAVLGRSLNLYIYDTFGTIKLADFNSDLIREVSLSEHSVSRSVRKIKSSKACYG